MHTLLTTHCYSSWASCFPVSYIFVFNQPEMSQLTFGRYRHMMLISRDATCFFVNGSFDHRILTKVKRKKETGGKTMDIKKVDKRD
jgi:hypothetical protein